MTKEELALKLKGWEYGDDVPLDVLEAAKESGLVIVHGYSDDNMEFEGAISDEFGCYEGGTCLVDKEGLLPDRDNIYDDDELEEYFFRKGQAKKIKAVWSPKKPDCSWIYKTEIPHSTFEIMEDGELYCVGLVFSLADL